MSPVHDWTPEAETTPHEAEPEPAFAARDTMSRSPREPRADRGERHRPHPESTPDMNTDELSSTSQRLTEELLRAMGFEPRVSVRAEGNRVDVTVEVERDDDLLNGRLGETRQALQHLLNRFLNKGDGSRYHLQLEVNDHWHQRESELAELAHRLAEEAATRQVEVVSDHLNSQERRILHMTLREDSRVKTYSLGMGATKRVAVAPASFPDRAEDDPAS
jgi:spoIIIJ-associated protein